MPHLLLRLIKNVSLLFGFCGFLRISTAYDDFSLYKFWKISIYIIPTAGIIYRIIQFVLIMLNFRTLREWEFQMRSSCQELTFFLSNPHGMERKISFVTIMAEIQFRWLYDPKLSRCTLLISFCEDRGRPPFYRFSSWWRWVKNYLRLSFILLLIFTLISSTMPAV